jgi:hypothetical protein
VLGLGLAGVTALAWRARTGAAPVDTPDERFTTTPEE